MAGGAQAGCPGPRSHHSHQGPPSSCSRPSGAMDTECVCPGRAPCRRRHLGRSSPDTHTEGPAITCTACKGPASRLAHRPVPLAGPQASASTGGRPSCPYPCPRPCPRRPPRLGSGTRPRSSCLSGRLGPPGRSLPPAAAPTHSAQFPWGGGGRGRKREGGRSSLAQASALCGRGPGHNPSPSPSNSILTGAWGVGVKAAPGGTPGGSSVPSAQVWNDRTAPRPQVPGTSYSPWSQSSPQKPAGHRFPHAPLTGSQAEPGAQAHACWHPGPKKPGSHSEGARREGLRGSAAPGAPLHLGTRPQEHPTPSPRSTPHPAPGAPPTRPQEHPHTRPQERPPPGPKTRSGLRHTPCWHRAPRKPALQEQLPSLRSQARVFCRSHRHSSEQPGPKAHGGQAAPRHDGLLLCPSPDPGPHTPAELCPWDSSPALVTQGHSTSQLGNSGSWCSPL